MKILALMGLILGCSQLLAAEIRIENSFMVKAERYHQFRAYLYKDDGTRVDVTNDAIWRSMGNRSRSPGEFLFPLPAFGSSDRFSARVEVTYNSDSGILTDSEMIWVDGSPDSIHIWGMTSTRSGGFVSLRADGYYGGKRVDLTQKGHWSAIYGRVSSWGHYTAPYLRNRNSVYDSVSFRFGMRTGRHSIMVRK
ncbi:MAG: hypothetical protein CME70_19860 [Halobacteriovorax sp.]|nr:hypothetical protein [Halobacteriovorax sp.]|tara:strand:- start:34239 stop:34820 length:582 start_codon:yes stop_codon:yes gene_type:complete